ncbi:sulfite exporter TauE/SafE family protein [Cytobacillus sp. FJAT-54145]|uniref:Probable membrane transporter protein n=1 Tax=Cytobacillus spartinae TaxID=3299023 RepID=A0ABW6KFC8_9BACI
MRCFILLLFLYFLLGGVISVMSGFFGVGGGFVLTPILLLLGYSPIEAITTSLFFTIGTSVSGMVAHIRLKNIQWKTGMILGLSGVVATQVARPFVLYLERNGFDEVVIPLFYIFLLSYFAISMFLQGKKPSLTGVGKSNSVNGVMYKMVLIGFLGGFISTTLGVGGGFIMVPLCISVLGILPKKAVGTSLFAVLMIVTVGFTSYAFTISIDYSVGIILILGGLIGSQFGAKFTTFFKNKEISLLLSMLYIATLGSVILKLAHLSLIGLILLTVFVIYFFTRSLMRFRVQRKSMNPAS